MKINPTEVSLKKKIDGKSLENLEGISYLVGCKMRERESCLVEESLFTWFLPRWFLSQNEITDF